MVGELPHKLPYLKEVGKRVNLLPQIWNTMEPTKGEQVFIDREVSRERDIGRGEIERSENLFAGGAVLSSKYPHRARGRRDKVKEHLNGRRLPRPVRPEKSGYRPFFDTKR